jgi:alpha-mannosidase
VPYQVSTIADPQAARRWAPERVALGQVDPGHLSEIVFLAEELPAVGYKTYQVVPCAEWPTFARSGVAQGEANPETPSIVENRFYRLELDPGSGAILSLLDKELGRELVDGGARHGLGQLIVRASGSGEEEVARWREVRLVEAGPVYTTLRLKGEASCCPRLTAEITLYEGVKRIDYNVRVLRDSTPMREVYLAFPFRVEDPHFRFEAAGSTIEPLRDQWPGSSTDAYAVQHWADVSNGEWGVVWAPLDTPMAEFGGLWPGYVSGAHHGVRGPGYGHPFLRPGELKQGHIYALVSYNNFRTNFVNVHPGEFVVRYAFGTHRGGWRAAPAFGWDAANPPLAVWMDRPHEAGVLPLATSFCQVDVPNVVLLTLKRAEDGDGYIARLIESAGQETEATVTLPYLPAMHAWETNLVEENQRLLSCTAHAVRVQLKPFAMATLRLGVSLGQESGG